MTPEDGGEQVEGGDGDGDQALEQQQELHSQGMCHIYIKLVSCSDYVQYSYSCT